MGEIEEEFWSINPESIRFRHAGKTEKFTVADLRGFGVDREVKFTRFQLNYQETATELEYADETFEGPVVNKAAWLRLLYSAENSLYELSTTRRKYFFYTGSDSQLTELIYRVRHTVTGEMEKDEQYKNRLIMLATAENEEKVRRQVNSMRYTDDDMLKVFSTLGGGKANFEATSAMGTRIDISGGVNFHTFSPKGDLYNDGSGAYAIFNADFKSSIGFIAGVGFTFHSKRNPKAVQSRLGVNIMSLKIDGINTTGTGSFQREKYDGTLVIVEPNASVDLPLVVKGNNTILLGAFFGFNVVVSNNFKSVFENPGVVIQKKNFPPADGGFTNFGLSATAQIAKNRFNLRAYNFSNIFDSPRTNLKGLGFSFTYGILLK